MFYRNFVLFILIIVLISTVAAGLKKPPLHNAFAIYDSKYDLIDKNNPSPIEEKIDEKEVIAVKPDATVDKKNITVTTKNVDVKPVTVTQPKTTVQSVKTVKNTTVQKTSDTVKPEKNISSINTTNTQNRPEKIQPVQTQTKTESKSEIKNETYVSQSEEIAWNQWHANLRNKIMASTNMPPVPDGTIFRYTFTLKKTGEILNLTVRSDNPNYTPYAIQYLAPAIRGLAYSKTVMFPGGSMRERVDIKSAFRVEHSNKAVYSSASNFNDREVIRKGTN